MTHPHPHPRPQPAVETLIALEQPALRRAAYELTGHLHEVDDLVQDTTLRLLAKQHQFRTGSNFSAWAAKVMRHLFYDGYRRRQRRRALRAGRDPRGGWAVATQAARPADHNALYAELARAVAALSPVLRESFELYYRGYRHHEIADLLQVPIGTVKSRVHHARRQLRGRFAPAA